MKNLLLRTVVLGQICFLVLFFSSCKGKYILKKKESTFQSIFNGKDLEGWHGDPKYWRVEDGILIGEVTPKTILKQNSFIIYQNVQPKNFELMLEYRISSSGNSGINYRSEIIENKSFALRGYQCDIDGKNKYTGQNYEEKKRTTLAYMGEIVTIPEMPKDFSKFGLRQNVKKNCWQTRTITETKTKLTPYIKSNDWNSIHLIVKEETMQHFVNGVLFSEVSDLDSINRAMKGYLGVQVHVGPPMKIEYRNIMLKQL
ncbi:MAG: DUF1080 domain-containing protein [Wenyingzhuangia sp.]|jgi:hypothetical protein|uniref:3-keto-disaccharide hydrolase n=1 Tax=Wenyingzhuangia sp. TaxID=1964193 RepID=UPI003219C7F5